jgi:4-amino-4-deoxy-L-arabinose transferase-like glycosyltransferase
VPAHRGPAFSIGRTDVAALALVFATTLLLRLFYVFRHAFNSDEPQHLHVAWAWTRGLVQYRDLFDNHTPLFHLLTAPLAALVGETPRLLFAARLAMIPICLAALWGTYAIGRAVFGRRAGLWAAALLGLIPTFFFKSLEFRPDVLWMALWILALAVLLGGALTWKRGLAAGLLLGAALGASIKTILLLAALGCAAIALPLLTEAGRRGLSARRIAPGLAGLLAGTAVVPFALILFLAHHGALRAFVERAVLHNFLLGPGRWDQPGRALLVIPAILVAVALARLLAGLLLPEAERNRLVLMALTAGFHLAALQTVAPVFNRQDLLPFYPLLSVLLTGLLLTVRPRFARHHHAGAPGREASGAGILAAVGILLIILLAVREPPWRDGTGPQVRLVEEVLRLTEPSDPVLDMKGETVFRRRPIDEVLEHVTRQLIDRGDRTEGFQERLIATRTCVASARIDGFPERTRRFLEENYMLVGEVRVTGRILAGPAEIPGRSIDFEVAVPAEYALVAERGAVAGILDGEPYAGPRFLDAGRHTLALSSGAGRVALIWARAVEKGFSPFAGARGTSGQGHGTL